MAKRTIKFLRVDELQVDDSYQRGKVGGHVSYIAENYDERRLRVPAVSQRTNGSYWLLDGQQRVAALILAGMGHKKIQCEVFVGLTISEEAQLFLQYQTGVVSVDPHSQFKARLRFGDPVATTIRDIVEGCGLRITNSTQHNAVKAVKALEYVQLSHDNLKLTMSILADWSDRDSTAFNQLLIRELSWFLHHYSATVPAQLAKRLKSHTPEAVINKVKRYGAINSELSKHVAASHVFRNIYNRKNRKKLPLAT